MSDKTRAERMWEAVNDALENGPIDIGPFVVGECTLSDNKKAVTVWTLSGNHREDNVLVNPPLLVPDPAGDIDVAGKKYREDPVAVLETLFRRVQEGKR